MPARGVAAGHPGEQVVKDPHERLEDAAARRRIRTFAMVMLYRPPRRAAVDPEPTWIG